MLLPSNIEGLIMVCLHGTLTKWNDDQGFGFITLPQAAPNYLCISRLFREMVRVRRSAS